MRVWIAASGNRLLLFNEPRGYHTLGNEVAEMKINMSNPVARRAGYTTYSDMSSLRIGVKRVIFVCPFISGK
jgi:hypothetical protein